MTDTAWNSHPAAARKGFVTVEGCRLHYIRQGSGPAVVLLHASPCSAKVMAPLQAQWAGEFTTFAFDLPGLGLSQAPEHGEITIARLADFIAAGMRALGLSNAALYGRHTGASVCLELALRHHDLAAMLLTDGLPLFSAPYTDARLAEYLPPIVPRWDGGHLTWTFFRYREQHMFWPWDAGDLAHRADADLPDLDFLHRGTLELLEAADTYARTYRAAFLHEALPRISEVTIPAFWGNRPGDSQFKTVERYPEGAAVHLMSRDPDRAALEELVLLRQHQATGPVPHYRSRFNESERPSELHDYIDTRHGQIRAWGVGLDRPGVPLIYLHDLPGSFVLHETEITERAQVRPVLAFDFGGNAESVRDDVPGIDPWVAEIEDVLAVLNWRQADIFAHGTSAAVALQFAERHPARVGAVELRSPPILSTAERERFVARYAPDMSPSEDGGYLLRLWHHLRDGELWFPWFQRDHTARRTSEPRIDPAWLTNRAVALLKQPQHYARIWRTLLAVDVAAALEACPVAVRITVEPTDVFAPSAQRHLARQG